MEVIKFDTKALLKERQYGWIEMSEDEYHLDTTSIGSSQLRAFLDSPNAFRQTVIDKEPKKDSNAFKYGKAVHCYILEPERFKELYVIEPEFWGFTQKGEKTNSLNCKEVKQKRDAFYSDLRPGARIITPEDLYEIEIVARNIDRYPQAKEILINGKSEVTGFIRDPITKINIKTRIDILGWGGKLLAEFKSAMSSRPLPFGSAVASNRYDIQIAMQEMVIFELCGFKPELLAFLVAEKESREIAIYYPDLKLHMDYARYWLRKGLNDLRACIDSDKWEMRQKEPEQLVYPEWFMKKINDFESDEAYEKFNREEEHE